MRKGWIPAVFLMLGALVCACQTTAPVTAPAGKKGTPLGVWHEQAEPSDTIEITKSNILYTRHDGSFQDEVKYRFDESGGRLEYDLEDFFIYEDMFYDRENDTILAHTWSHTDGDGGYHPVEYRRSEYIAPPEPTYAPPEDNSDPDAKKDFPDMEIRTMKVSFYDEGEPYDVNSSMAMQPPFADSYSYELTVLPEGTGVVSSSFCGEIELTADQVEELNRLAREADLGQVNGLDIHTEGLPYGSPEYEAEITLASGEVIRSSANGEQVPENWSTFQYSMHRLLFFAFVDAGYHYGTGEFHSTKPMKRVQGEETLRGEETGILEEETVLVPDWKKSYDYSLDTKYFVFSDPDNRYPALMKTLDRISAEYKAKAEETLKKHYETMERVPANVRKQADRRYSYSLYAVDHWSLSRNIFSFLVSEGEANSLGAGDYGYGTYRYCRFNIDVNTGKILSASDLFTGPEALYDVLMEKYSGYGTHNDSGKFVHSDAFPALLKSWLEKPEPEGFGFSFTYDYVEFWMPLGAFEGNDSQMREVLYYDEIQDILSDEYTSEW